VVHTHSAKAGFLGRLAATSLRIPAVVHTVHGAPFHSYQNALARGLFRWCEWYAARKCHALISVANAMTDLMVKAGVAPREKFTTIYSGLDVEPFLRTDEHRDRLRAQLGFQPEDIVIGKIARLFHLKGHSDVLKAAGDVIKANPHVKFLFIGDGILQEKLQHAVTLMGMSKSVHFTGLVSPQEIPTYVGAMDILVHASLREGLARALPQALIAGKPVVSYDIDGAREVVLNGETGFLVPPRWEALVRPLVTLAGDPALREKLGQEGQKRFTNQFRHEVMTHNIRQLYERLLNTSKSKI
jgi:glycosyltransferase involved in cell wall biosynthesis